MPHLEGPVLGELEGAGGQMEGEKQREVTAVIHNAQGWRPFCRPKADREMLPDTCSCLQAESKRLGQDGETGTQEETDRQT